MITLLSPAKKMNFDEPDTLLQPTRPPLHDHTTELAAVAKKQTAPKLKALMHISDNLAKLNRDRFKAFNLDGQSNSAKPAILTFDGDVYWGLNAASMTDSDLEYAQDHVRILSGLYGVLRPMDSIQAHRLEMGTKLKTKRGKSLYEFWGSTPTDYLNAALDKHRDHTVINLASNEYFKVVDRSALKAPIIECKFLNVKDGKSRNLMYYAKFGRGLMARWIVQNQINKAGQLKDFNLQDYKYDKAASEDGLLVFSRKQPPPKNG